MFAQQVNSPNNVPALQKAYQAAGPILYKRTPGQASAIRLAFIGTTVCVLGSVVVIGRAALGQGKVTRA
eukprot:m.18615 g.18615  ORF g.18615 m.18615 type:complete len:69 (+) comp7918_c0_seq1:311-517(+)